MRDLKWSHSEKKIARAAFDAARDFALVRIMAEFKARAQSITNPSEMWALEDYLRTRSREIDEKFDYRYSQLPLVFARLIRDGYLDEARLAGLSNEQLKEIDARLSWMRSE